MSRMRPDLIRTLILLLAVAGFAVLSTMVGVRYLDQQVAPSAKAATEAEPSAVELAVERLGDVLVVRWNPNTSVVAGATHGLLSITDGAFERRIGLNVQDLRLGSARYAPLSRNVSFQLAVYLGPASGKGVVLFLAKGGDEAGDGPVLPESDVATIVPPSLLKQAPHAPANPANTKSRRRNAEEEEELEEESVVRARAVETRVITPTSQVETDQGRAPIVALPPIEVAPPLIQPIPVKPAPTYRVTVTSGPARANRLEQVLGRVPFVRRIAKAPLQGELVQPVRKVEPELVGAQVTEPVDTSVEIHVDDDGSVKSAKFLDLERAPGNLEWASLRAAESWKFESPKDGQSTWLVLTFHYEPVNGVRGE